MKLFQDEKVKDMSGDGESVVNLSEILRQVYLEATLDFAIDYSVQSIPVLSEGDFQWVRSLRV
ncbi:MULTISPECIES: DUF4058 family protein [unclassified Microcoleus]|uniref:DUF4058 family protein n=1 Tax=unclassified Microcoleus TaxID=2642155 RepID=UPI002FD38F34